MVSQDIVVGNSTLRATMVGNVIYLSDLQGSGDPRDLSQIIKQVKELSKDFEVFLTVDFNNPRFNQIMDVYTGKGAVPKAVLLKVEI